MNTVLKVNGLRKKSSLNEQWNRHFVLGYTDEETVMLDFDNTPLACMHCIPFCARGIMGLKQNEG